MLTEWVHDVQVMKMCEVFARFGGDELTQNTHAGSPKAHWIILSLLALNEHSLLMLIDAILI
ncbi:MAG: hypothetical protein Greene07147_773 [Parcubacteria group bacterium Greene0714_7]|nr:MAG: hypothetical protein Greene07147_773 [Parcubacteria group bacterium Greene0714_7]